MVPATVRNIIQELPIPSLRPVGQTEFETDVLVIGSSYAGTMAALKAHSMGQKVIVVDKGLVGKSGFGPWANTMFFYDETLGDKREDWIQAFQGNTEYLVDLDYLDMFINDSLARFLEWRELGIATITNIYPTPEQLIQYSQGVVSPPADRRWLWPKIFKDRGIQVVERVMLTDLLVKDGIVMGAMGIPMESEATMIFRATATVMCAGQGGYKAPGYPIHCSTFDGDAMAYNIGAKIGGKEWVDFHGTGGMYPADCWKGWQDNFKNRIYATVPPKYRLTAGGPGGPAGMVSVHLEGDRVVRRPRDIPEYVPVDQTLWENVRYDSDNNRPPESRSELQRPGDWNVSGAGTGLGVHCTEGVFPVDTNCWSGIPGLYAAGDALCSRLNGTKYVGKGCSSSSAGVFGYRAGEAAANYAAGVGAPSVSADEISRIQEDIMAPRNREKGYDPRWVQNVLLTTMAPYYILKMKHKKRLEGALENVTFMRDHLAPKVMASNPHELRLCHEVHNMVQNAEMKLRASLLREESRGSHWREDFPYRDDKNWLAWTTCQKDSEGNMEVSKVPVPDRMKTNKDWPYAERYAIGYLGEEEAIARLGIT